MIKCYWSSDGLWYLHSTKGEIVHFVFRIGITEKNFLKIYDIIIWKLRIAWTTKPIKIV